MIAIANNIAQTLLQMGLERQVMLITHELTPARKRMLRDGIIDAIIDQNPYEEARRSLEVLARHFNHLQDVVSYDNYTPFHIYIRENCPLDGIPG